MTESSGYRSDIDGLRALAVVAVILFHFEVSGFSGGFTGVDIFFVISGYLIIGIIIKEINAGTFSLVNFWERRIRRIIPAMVVVLLATAVGSYYLLILPIDFIDFGQSLMAQGAFISNWWFMIQSDYFTAPAGSMPLLHTWTLAVEEQFYIIFPLFAVLVCKYKKSRLGQLMTWTALFSFIYGVLLVNVAPAERFSISFLPHLWGSATNYSAGFYFILPRLWEFLLGGIIAVYALHVKHKGLAEVIATLGMGFIFIGIFLFSESTPFPGVAALLPVLGTVAVLVANTKHRTKICSILSIPIITWVGLLSYSLYLWHWPVLVLAKYQQLSSELLSRLQLGLLFLLVFILSVITYYWVEKPIRQRRIFAQSRDLFLISSLGLVVILMIGFVIVKQQGFPARVSENAQLLAVAMSDKNPRTEECFTSSSLSSGRSAKEPCLLGVQDQSNIDFVLWGDSHADAVLTAFDAYGLALDKTGIFFGASSCPPLLANPPISANKICQQEVKKAVTYINNNTPEEVFLVAEWKEGYTFVESGVGLYLSRLLANTISNLPAETKVTVFQRLPTYPAYTFRDLFMAEERQFFRLQIVWPRSEFENSLQVYSTQINQAILPFSNARTLDPLDTLCDADNCYMGTSEALYYHDSSHLTTFGAKQIILPLLLSTKK